MTADYLLIAGYLLIVAAVVAWIVHEDGKP